MRQLLRFAIRQLCNTLGLDLVRTETTAYLNRLSLEGVLHQVATLGSVQTVLDVGAAQGYWSVECSKQLPNATYILMEPLREYEPLLKQSVANIPRASCHSVGVSNHSGERVIHVHPDLVGSSFYLEDEQGNVNGEPRTIRIETLDAMCQSSSAQAPYLLKIDVQGAELDVLEGAGTILPQTEFAIIETSFFRFYENGTTIVDLIAYMNERGFVPYDVFSHSYRPLDQALAQVDLCFVQNDGPYRTHHHYATPEQRDAQNQRLRSLTDSPT